MFDLITIAIVIIFAGIWVTGIVFLLISAAGLLALPFHATKGRIPGNMGLNPLNIILYPEYLDEEGLKIRKTVIWSAKYFILMVILGFSFGGMVILVAGLVR